MKKNSTGNFPREKIIQEILANCPSSAVTENAIFNLQYNGVIESINAPALQIVKKIFSTSLSPGDSIFDIISTQYLETFGKQLKSTFSGSGNNFKIPTNEAGKIMDFWLYPVFDEFYRVKYIQVLLTLKISEEPSINIDDNLKELFDNSAIGIFLARPNGAILDANHAATIMYGYSVAEFKKLGRKALFIPGDGELKKMLENRKKYGHVKGELTAIKKTGGPFPIQVFSSVYKDASGQELISTAIIDISQQRRQEIELTRISQIFKSLFHNHPDAVFSFDKEGKFISVNPSAVKLSEGSLDRLLDLNFAPLIPQTDLSRVFQHFERASQGEVQNYNTGFISLKGTRKILNITNFPIITSNKITGVFGVARDVTESEGNKQKVEKSRERLKKIMDQSLDVICTIDIEGRFVEVSAASLENWGYARKELIGRKYMDLVHPEDVKFTRNVAREIMQGMNTTNFYNRYIKKDGSISPNIWAVRWEEEEKLMYCIAKDASEILEAQKQILNERNLLRAIIDNIPDYIFVLDEDHKTVLTNKKFYSDYLGKKSENDVLGLHPKDYFPINEAKEITVDNSRVMESGIPVINRRDVVYGHTGKKDIILLTKVPFKRDDGEVSGLVGIARNITDVYNLEQEQKFIYKLINSLGNTATLHAALSRTIKLITQFLHLDAAEAWEVGYSKNQLLKSAEFNTQNNIFGKDHEVKTFKNGKGLPGITWEKAKVQVWQNLDSDSRFLRRGPAIKNKISLGIGVPIIYKKEVVAVLTFFGKTLTQKEVDISSILERVALQIATDIQRKMTEARLNNLYKYSPSLIAVIGLDGYLKKVNPAFLKVFGHTEEELLNTPFTQFLHIDEKNSTNERLKEVAGGSSPSSFQNRCLTKWGEWKWISWTSAGFLEEEGIVHLFGTDITQLKLANLDLLKYKNIIESTKDGIGLISIENNEVFLNNALREILGFSESELSGVESIKELYADENLSEKIYSALLSGNFWDGDVQLKTRKGEILDYHLSAGPIENGQGELIALFGLHTDISERKAYEASLQKYGNRITNILESITDGFFSLTPTWEVTYWNNAAEKMLNVSPENILKKNLWEYFPKAKSLLFYEKYMEALLTKKKVFFEEFFEPLNIWLEVNAYPGGDGLSVYFKDITNRKRVDLEIQLAKERYDLVAKATREAVYDWDIPNNRLEWSGYYHEIYGYKDVGTEKNLAQWAEQLHKEDKDIVIAKLEASINSKDTEWNCEYRLVQANGKIAVVLERGFIIRNERGEALRMIGSLQDISQIKYSERALEELNFKLQQHANELALSNAELEQFAYIASHDLQEPLRMVTGFLTQLQKKYENQLDERAQQYIHFATDGAVRMRQIILDLLEYSRVGKLNYEVEEIDLNKMLENIVRLHENLITETGAAVNFQALPVIQAALTPLQRVLSNLISNSIKYSKKGEKPLIDISVIENPSSWEFIVTDNGIGISEKFYEKIFIIFQRLHSKDEYSGTGIGLAICKKIVENHGGRIWVESQVGNGSTFHFTIQKHF